MRFRPLLAVIIVLSGSALGQTARRTSDLVRAQKSFEELQYAEAGRWLEGAWLTPGNTRAQVLEILKLQAVVAATLGQQDRARSFFKSLLYLAPDFELEESDLGPKVLSLYYEAKGRVSVEGALGFEPGPIDQDQRQVHQISARVTDPQQLARSVRFHTRARGLWSQTDVPLTDGLASLTIDAPGVEWWAELLGEKERVLAQLRSAAEPITVSATSLVPREEQGSAFKLGVPSLKTVSYVAAGAGALAAIGGLVFGIRSNNQKNQIVAAERDTEGRVIGISRERALVVEQQQRGSATVANSLFVTSVVLVGAGVVLYLLAPEVKVSAGPGGVALAGSLP